MYAKFFFHDFEDVKNSTNLLKKYNFHELTFQLTKVQLCKNITTNVNQSESKFIFSPIFHNCTVYE